MNRIYVLCILWICCFFQVYGAITISEISYDDPEFIEFMSEDSIDMVVVQDESGVNKSYTCQGESDVSSCYLIVGKSFQEKEIAHRCSICDAPTLGVGYRNLKNAGENVIVWGMYNSTLIGSDTLVLESPLKKKEGYSVHVRDTQQYYAQMSPGINKIEQLSKKQESCVFDSEYEVKEERLYFSFNINEKEEIVYWIEHNGSIVKNKHTTSSGAKKQFTPKESGVYMLHAYKKYETKQCPIITQEVTFERKRSTLSIDYDEEYMYITAYNAQHNELTVHIEQQDRVIWSADVISGKKKYISLHVP